jgi:hypothetical protein
MAMTTQTIGEWVEAVAAKETSSESDGRTMQDLLRKVGFPLARVAYGIVYLEGKGTMEFPPTSIQAVANTLKEIE